MGETDLNWEAETSRDVEAEWKADWDTLSLAAQFGGERRISETLDAVVTVTSEGGTWAAAASSLPRAGL